MAFRMNISRSGTIIAVSTRLWPDADFSFLTLPIRRRIRFSNLKFQIPESCRYPKSHSAHHTKSSPNERNLQGEPNTAKPQSPSHFKFQILANKPPQSKRTPTAFPKSLGGKISSGPVGERAQRKSPHPLSAPCGEYQPLAPLYCTRWMTAGSSASADSSSTSTSSSTPSSTPN